MEVVDISCWNLMWIMSQNELDECVALKKIISKFKFTIRFEEVWVNIQSSGKIHKNLTEIIKVDGSVNDKIALVSQMRIWKYTIQWNLKQCST